MPASPLREDAHDDDNTSPSLARPTPFPRVPSLPPLHLARTVLNQEGTALQQLAARLNQSFCDATEMLLKCKGSVVVTGIGKAGLIGQKTSATLSSLAIPSHFLHPSEAVHGDLGRIHANDVILILSFSGESDEILRLLPSFANLGNSIVAVTRQVNSSLGRSADCVIALGSMNEADPLGLAPSTTTTAMLAIGDALAFAVAQQQRFNADRFARNHPGGALGRKLTPVEQAMRGLDRCRVASQSESVRDVLTQSARQGRRTGAVLLVDTSGKLTGIFTDSDLARLFEQRRETALDEPIANVMSRQPATVTTGALLPTAVSLLADRKISELPVVDRQGKPVGLIDITDVVTTDATGHETTIDETLHASSGSLDGQGNNTTAYRESA